MQPCKSSCKQQHAAPVFCAEPAPEAAPTSQNGYRRQSTPRPARGNGESSTTARRASTPRPRAGTPRISRASSEQPPASSTPRPIPPGLIRDDTLTLQNTAEADTAQIAKVCDSCHLHHPALHIGRHGHPAPKLPQTSSESCTGPATTRVSIICSHICNLALPQQQPPAHTLLQRLFVLA